MSFQNGLSGLNASSKALNAISNNIANSSTVGFKEARAQFTDIYAGSFAGSSGSQIGIGASVNSISQQFTQGAINVSSNPLDVAINGQGFFRMNNHGSITYTRNGQFQLDKDGYLTNSAGSRVTGYPTDANNKILPYAPEDIRIDNSDLKPQPTGSSDQVPSVGVNLDSREPIRPVADFDKDDASTYNASTSMTVYDSLGVAQILTMFFNKTDENKWAVSFQMTGPQLTAPANAGSLTLQFAPDGTPMSTNKGAIGPVDTQTGANPLDFRIDMTRTTQFGSQFGVNSIEQDGFTSGRLSGLTVAQNGVLRGRYSNGQTRDLAQVVIANFNNPNGLVSLGGSQWADADASGAPIVAAPGSGSLGTLQSGAIEESNVDLTRQLVDMITHQRTYQANAQSIRTQDQVLQTLVNLKS